MSDPEVRQIVVKRDEPSPDHVLFEVTVKGGRVECVWCGPTASVGVDITGDLMCNDCKRYVAHPTQESTEYNA
jgi:hypothetical protein